MRPDHSSTPNETLPSSSAGGSGAAHAHSGRSSAPQATAGAAASASTASRGMGGSGRAHGAGGGERGTAARPMKAVDVPELVLKLCKIVLKKERDVSF